MQRKYPLLFLVACLAAALSGAYGQVGVPTNSGQNVIRPAVPFLRIVPDARSGAMGDAGVATSPDANAIHFNAARLAFINNKFGVSASYTPWLRKLVGGMAIMNASGYYKIDNNQVVGLAFTYFNFGDSQGKPVEYSIAGSYSRKLTDRFGFSVGLKYIYSDITAISPLGNNIQPGRTAAGDIGIYYTNGMNMLGEEMDFAFGASITNIGPTISYAGNNDRQYIPTTLRFGPAFTYPIDEDSRITFTLDINKLLVPTVNSPARSQSFTHGVLNSFTDAPGGFSEELKEFYYAGGMEFAIKNTVFLRGGYYTEHRDKGNNKYFTLGGGVRYKAATFDVSYLLGYNRPSPLDDTMRFTLRLDFGAVSDENNSPLIY